MKTSSLAIHFISRRWRDMAKMSRKDWWFEVQTYAPERGCSPSMRTCQKGKT